MSFDTIIGIIFESAAVIALAAMLAKTVYKYVSEKNWNALISLALECMKEAENLFDNVTDRKTYVMQAISKAAELLNYIYTDKTAEKMSVFIDETCEASKIINSGGAENAA